MKNLKIEAKWALIFCIILLLWMVLEKSLGWHDEHIKMHSIYTMLFAPVAILIYYLALRDKQKNHYKGNMSWLRGFLSGLIISAIVAVLSPLTQYITHEYISPDYFANQIEYAVENDKSTRAEAEAVFNLQSYISQTMIFAIIFGGATAAGIMTVLMLRKKKKTSPVESPDPDN